MGQHSYRFTVAVFLLIMIASAGEAAGQGHASARIEALGGSAMTGIVRDTLTDIYLSPAFLASCERLTINYGQRRSPELHLGFPNLHKESHYGAPFTDRSYYSIIAGNRSNEITTYGARIGTWRLAASVEWHLDYNEQSNPYGFSYNNSIPNVTQTYRHLTKKKDNRYVRADITAARELSGGYALGLRIGGSTAKVEDSRTAIESTQKFGILIDPYELDQEYRGYGYDMREKIRSRSGGFVQAGLLHSSDGSFRSVDLRVTRYDTYLRESLHDITSRTWYDEWGDPDIYERTEQKWRDERYGSMWSYDFTGRIWSETGIRLFAGLGFEHMTYSTKWRDLYYKYDWKPLSYYEWDEWDQRATMVFDGEGDYAGLRACLKIGKAKRLRDDLEITVGIHSWAEKHWTEEKPLACITLYSLIDGSLFYADLDKPLELSTNWIEAGFGIPAAIEFEPAHWISIWSGFRVYTRYRRFDDEMPEIDARYLGNITSYLELEDYTPAYDTYRLDDVDVGSTATVGVSLHYRDRFFVDIYTGSDVTPDYLTNYILDVRYVF
jgi:hypothetical protein